jgi:16S rRNA (guanine(966)-N(2))-methyltransferase RsmD
MIRVIAGQAGGRYLKSPRGLATRPTASRVRESIFSRLAARIEFGGRSVLDLFAGSGALGIEALSRGAERATFVDSSRAAARVIAENLRTLDLSHRARVMCLDVFSAMARVRERRETFDLVFMDAPYGKELTERTLQRLIELKLLASDAWLAVELSSREATPALSPIGKFLESTIGDHRIALYCFGPSDEALAAAQR